jgi:hypothetical protein
LIYDWLKENGANGPKAIHKGLVEEGYTGTLSTIQNILSRMAKAGTLQKGSGVYFISSKLNEKPVEGVEDIKDYQNIEAVNSTPSISSIRLSEEEA